MGFKLDSRKAFLVTSSQRSSVAADGDSSGVLVSFVQDFQVHLEGKVTDLPHLGSSPKVSSCWETRPSLYPFPKSWPGHLQEEERRGREASSSLASATLKQWGLDEPPHLWWWRGWGSGVTHPQEQIIEVDTQG